MLVTLVSILVQGLVDDFFEPGRNRGIDTSHWGRRAGQNRLDNHAARAATERLAARCHFVEHETEREDVRARVEAVSSDLLRRHVRRSAANDSNDGIGILRFGFGIGAVSGDSFGNKFCEAEIEDLGSSSLGDENICGFDVAVNDSFCVRRLESFRYFDAQLEQFFERKRLPVDVSAQRFAVDEFHGDECVTILLADVVDGANAGMVEGGCGACFATEAVERLRLLCEFFRKEFQRYRAFQAAILSFEHDAHAAGAELLYDAVVRDRLTNHFLANRCLANRCV